MGDFVEGATSSSFRPNGGRGGGGRGFGRKPTPRRTASNNTALEAQPKANGGAAKVDATTDDPLPPAAALAVKTLAAVSIRTARVIKEKDKNSDKGSDKAESTGASKATRKKKKLSCYRCGVPGHFMMDCMAVLHDICLKLRPRGSGFSIALGP